MPSERRSTICALGAGVAIATLVVGCGGDSTDSTLGTVAPPVASAYITVPAATVPPTPAPTPAPAPAPATTPAPAGQAPSGSTAGSTADGTPGSTTGTATGSHTIAEDDSLYGISQQYCITLDELIAANGWTDGPGHLILPGDTIVIPGDGCG